MSSRKFKPDAEVAQQKRQDALDRLTQGIEQLLESGNWQRYLQTQAKFHKYSFKAWFKNSRLWVTQAGEI